MFIKKIYKKIILVTQLSIRTCMSKISEYLIFFKSIFCTNNPSRSINKICRRGRFLLFFPALCGEDKLLNENIYKNYLRDVLYWQI